jgi:hypothetical protein
MRKPTLSGTQSVIGLMAGIFSVFGGVYTGVQYFTRSSGTGDIVAIVRDARTVGPSPAQRRDSREDDALVTTLVPGDSGQARRASGKEPTAYVSRTRAMRPTRAGCG